MLPAWATVVLTLGGFVLGALGGLAGVRLQNHYAERQRLADKLDQRRERGAEAVAPVRALLVDTNPDPYVGLAHIEAVRGGFDEHFDRWVRLRDPLLIFTSGHPSSEVVKTGSELADAVSKSFTRTRMAILAAVRSRGSGDLPGDDLPGDLSAAMAQHATAVSLADRLLWLVREEEEEMRPLSETFGPLDGEG